MAANPVNSAQTGNYTRTAVALHWLMAALIVGAFCLGWIMTDLAVSPLKLKMFNWHKWLGITILACAVLRALWKLTHPAPPLLPMPAWQKAVARASHWLLYLLMFVIPVSGWAYSNAAGYPIVYLGLWRLPDLVAKNKELADRLVELHEWLGWLLLATLAAHVAGALKHHLIDHDDTLRRMLGRRRAAS